MKVLTPEEMRAVDSRAIDEIGIPGLTLMENAGRSVAEWVLDYLPDADMVVVLAGRGNNGGDGLVAARYLAENGRLVKVILLRGGKELSPDCKTNLDQLPENIDVRTIDNADEFKSTEEYLSGLAMKLADSTVNGGAALIDALLGTGVRGEIKGLTADLLTSARNLGWPCVACDIPSGIDGLTGEYLGAGIPAVATVTMGLPKNGLYLGAGVEYSGQVIVADIGFPPEATAPSVQSMETIEIVKVARLFSHDRSRPDEIALHKGDFGKVLVVAGSRGMVGANELTSRAASRVGAGLVVSAIPVTEYQILASRTSPEIMTTPIPAHDPEGCFSIFGLGDLKKYFEWADVLAIGPGLSAHEEALEFARQVVKEFPNTPDHQIVIDADGLRAFIDDPALLKGRHRAPILTPHPGEFLRLTAPHDLPNNLLERVKAYSEISDSVIVLKGARTIVVTPRETPGCEVSVNVECGNPGMASGGSGDVLTGILAGLAGQATIAWDPYQIACTGVLLHAFAGDLAAKRLSRQALIAPDIIDSLPKAFKIFSKNSSRRQGSGKRRRN